MKFRIFLKSFENELIDELIDLFPNKDYDSASPEVMDYISQAIK